jgi:hypothetical protein
MEINTKKIVKRAAGAIATSLLIKLLVLQLTAACPSPLQCANFTQPEKIQDCNYITSQGLSYTEQQDTLCLLWDQDYNFPVYQNPAYPQAQANFTFSPQDIETSRFILFFKIVIFFLFNYILFAFLTRTSFFRKCLPAG